MIPVKAIFHFAPSARSPGSERSRPWRRCPMTWRFWTVVLAMATAMVFFFAPPWPASSFQAVDKIHLAKIETKTRQLLDAVEHLQGDIVEELSGVKEKVLFQKVDQVLHELAKMDKSLRTPTPTREVLYKQFDSIDGKVTVLRKAVSEQAPKHPVLLRDAERIVTLTDDLHYVVSQGDVSPLRFRQVLARQARAMSDVAKKKSLAAQYALGDKPGRGELLVDMKKLVEACKSFETVAASPADLEKCRKEFATLNDAWGRMVQGISLLPPNENIYLIRGASRADIIHERLFRALEIKGERPFMAVDT
jgi:hypothetical protein